MALTRALVPQMKERRWGRIIHISSIMGLASKDGATPTRPPRAALIGLAQASALDLGRIDITVNCIAPGPFLTDLPARADRREKSDLRRSHGAGPLGRAARAGRPRPAAGQRSRQLHHRRRAGRRRRLVVQDVLISHESRAGHLEMTHDRNNTMKRTRFIPFSLLLIGLLLANQGLTPGRDLAASRISYLSWLTIWAGQMWPFMAATRLRRILISLPAKGSSSLNITSRQVCSPTRSGLLTGRCWSRFGVTSPQNERALPWDTVTLPEGIEKRRIRHVPYGKVASRLQARMGSESLWLRSLVRLSGGRRNRTVEPLL